MSSAALLPRSATKGVSKSRDCNNESRNEARAIRRGFSWLAAGNIVNAACSWGRLALLARLGNADMVGQLTLALAVCKPIADFADIGLSGALVSDAQREFRLRDYIGLRFVTCILAMFIIAAIAFTGYDAATARLIALAGLLMVCESLCDIFQAVLQRDERMQWVAISLIVRGIAGLALFAGILWSTHNLAWAVTGFCIATVATLIVIDVPRALLCDGRPVLPKPKSQISNLKFEISDFRLFRLAWLSLPLGLATASLTLTTSIPRYWIAARLGNSALGGFAIAGSLMIAMSYVVGALSQAASPRLARYHAAGDHTAFLHLISRLSSWLALLTIASVAVMAIAGRPIIGLLFGAAFVPYAALATCLMLAAGLRNFSILFGRTITSMRRFRTGLALRLLGIAILIALLPGWIDWLGLMGAAWAVTLSWLITTLLSLAVVLRAR
jgi:O-antigen/teichoic acid export membrane protein